MKINCTSTFRRNHKICKQMGDLYGSKRHFHCNEQCHKKCKKRRYSLAKDGKDTDNKNIWTLHYKKINIQVF